MSKWLTAEDILGNVVVELSKFRCREIHVALRWIAISPHSLYIIAACSGCRVSMLLEERNVYGLR